MKDLKIAASERTALVKAIEAQVGPPDSHDTEMASEDLVRRAVQNANIKMISLSQDDKDPPEVVVQVQHFCSPTGNCSLWFFRRTPHGYRLVLDAIGQGFTVEKTTTGGFRDLVINMHSSATDQWLKVYRYARGRYWRVACYDADWEKPRIVPSPCD